MKSFFLIIILMTLLTGCVTTYSDGPFNTESGSRFDYFLVDHIVDGQTPKSKIHEFFGTPHKAGAQREVYWSVECRISKKETLFKVMADKQCIERTLTINYSGDVVLDHNYEKIER
jgi:hypothetical protein